MVKPSNYSTPAENTRSRSDVQEIPEQREMAAQHHFLSPPSFSGKKEEAARWLDKFRRYAENKDLIERAKINDFFHLLGGAYDYCSSLTEEQKNDWEELEEDSARKGTTWKSNRN